MEAYQRLEREYAEFCNNQNTVACSSGTAALHLALETLRVTESWGSHTTQEFSPKVVVPDFAMIACARAVTLAGMVPEFVDVNELGLLEYPVPAPHSNERHFEIPCDMVVHTYGRKSSYVDASDVNDKTVFVEDLAEAHGIQVRLSSIACWSFYKNKIIHGEEGGMVAFATGEQQTLAKKLRNMGFEDGQTFQHIPRGMNYRMSNVHALLVLDSLHKFEANRLKRIDVEGWYDEHCLEEWRLPQRDVPWVYDLDLPQDVDMEKVVRDLNGVGIRARCGFKPLSQQKEYTGIDHQRWSDPGEAMLDGVPFKNNPVADRISKTRMYLPIYTWMTKPLVRRTMELLEGVVDSCKKSPI